MFISIKRLISLGVVILLTSVSMLTMGPKAVQQGEAVEPDEGNDKQKVAKTSDNLPEERPIAFVRRFKPQVNIFNAAAGKFAEAEKAEKLYDGDTLMTGKDGYAAVQFMDKSLTKVKPSSLLLINGSVDNSTQSNSTRILLKAGEVMMDVEDRNRGDFEVATQTSVATVKGTKFGSSVDSKGSSTHFVLEGSVEVFARESNQRETITDGQFARVSQDGQDIETGQLEDDELDQRQKEFDDFDKKLESKKVKFRFRGEDGEIREIELEYYENDQQ